MAQDNFFGFCLGPRAQLIIEASCLGRFCHLITSPVSRWHIEVTDCHALAERWPPDVPVVDSSSTGRWQANIRGVIRHPVLPWPPSLPLPPIWPPLLPRPLLSSSPPLGLHTDPSPPSRLPHPPLLVLHVKALHQNHPLSCMSTAFVCGGKHLRNVLWLRRPWKHRCSLCGLAYSELV